MPEQPDLDVYAEQIAARTSGGRLRRVRLVHPFLLRTADPPLAAAEGLVVSGVRRLGKRVVISLDGGLHLVLHLMLAGRLRWTAAPKAAPARGALAHFDFDGGTLTLTEAGTRRRASLHVVRGEAGLAALDAGGLAVLDATPATFAERLRLRSHTLKRALTSPDLFSGIGNAYSDEILHRARLSPLALTRSLDDAQVDRLRRAAREVLSEWTERLRQEAASAPGGWPAEVTAFRPGMAVHGRYGRPCPDCGAPVQRIWLGERECNYCARCQTEGRLLADRALSRLLKADWPKTIDDLD